MDANDSWWNDPCLEEDFGGIRKDPRFRERFPWCPF